MTGLLKSAGKLSRFGFGLFREIWPSQPNLASTGSFSVEAYLRHKAAAANRLPIFGSAVFVSQRCWRQTLRGRRTQPGPVPEDV